MGELFDTGLGTPGSVVDTLVVALGPGGVATASVLIAWIRRRKSDVTLKETREDGSSFELHATNVPELGDRQHARGPLWPVTSEDGARSE